MTTIGSLFSGIGGIELGLEWAGLGPVLYQVEIEDHARAICAKHWPAALRFRDIHDVGRRNLPHVDIVCGGSPCVGFSRAGAQGGLDDPRSGLWKEYARVIDETRPRYVVFENVAQIRTLHDGRHFRGILGDLADLGMDAFWWQASAADIGAPQLRERLWVVGFRRAEILGHADRAGLARRRLPGSGRADRLASRSPGRPRAGSASGRAVAILDRVLDGVSGRVDPNRWPAERDASAFAWEPPRTTLEGKGRRARLSALGNAVVPQAARIAGEVIRKLEEKRGVLR